jgi:hypothetical protein
VQVTDRDHGILDVLGQLHRGSPSDGRGVGNPRGVPLPKAFVPS